MKTLLVGAGLAAAVVLGVTSQAHARAKQELVVIYYDEEYRNIVGQNLFFCDGTHIRIGALTLFSEEIYYGCD
jgi:hypothetical protein